jgi:hypothetical protein
MNHFSLKDSIAFIEHFTGEKMSPEEIDELRQVLVEIRGNLEGDMATLK